MQNWVKRDQKVCPSNLCLPTLILAIRPFVPLALRPQRQHKVQNLGCGKSVGPKTHARLSDSQVNFHQKRRELHKRHNPNKTRLLMDHYLLWKYNENCAHLFQKIRRGTHVKKNFTYCMHFSTTPSIPPKPARWASITSASRLPVTLGDKNTKNQKPLLSSSSSTATIYHFTVPFLQMLILRAVKTLRKYKEK